ncbi:hypothetical protein K3U93_07730 [Mycobacterium malmoense]|uniref:PE-PGRS family protein n=1 Tax=Mycobacterium malmoense TaxID=1780 RepID=A0ABX3SKW6_MYCMA|nr:hypothetical protein [Mycobacterium malmoense]ORA76919.1 hypothetical protein BST29_24300 [Mycobacterium malmoense]QZA19014.1 hypothetical protein K3U93_07730 [Mycobacterium malmoense]UNB95778.1 hypothetical protein H5T25_07700 [Mycobacterium malmoense]
MQQLAAFRPLVSAGAAAVGASLIALTPAVSNDVAADLQQSVVSIQHRAVELTTDEYAVNPLQTWLDVFTDSAANLQTIYNTWSQIPAVLAQQVGANWIQYADTYVGGYQAAANGTLTYFTGTNPLSADFWPLVTTALTNAQSGDIYDAVGNLLYAFYQGPILGIFEPMENILTIPVDISKNIGNATPVLLGTPPILQSLIVGLGEFALQFGQGIEDALGESLQVAYNAYAAGDLLGAALNLLNTPGVVADAALNASAGGTAGLLSPGGSEHIAGLLSLLVNTVPKLLAEAIPAPGAQNITAGGSLLTAWQGFLNQFLTGWPSPNEIVDNILNVFRTYAGLPGLASAANVGSVADVATTASAAASLSANFASVTDLSSVAALSVLPADIAGVLPGDVANIAGHLGADLASVLPGMILSILHF